MKRQFPRSYRQPEKLYAFQGSMLSAQAIGRVLNLPASTVRARIEAGHPPDKPRRTGVAPKLYEFRGKQATVYEIMAATGLARTTALKRISGNVFIEHPDSSNVPFEPRRDAHLLTYSGKTQSLTRWARELGIPISTLFSRLVYGWPAHEALTRPIERKGKRAVRLLAIKRLVRSFRAGRYQPQPMTGGSSKTFHASTGTGAGRQVSHFDGGRP